MAGIQYPPEGYEFVTDINEKVQVDDLIWCEEEKDWTEVGRFEIGLYACHFSKIVRPLPQQHKVPRIKRSRRPQKH